MEDGKHRLSAPQIILLRALRRRPKGWGTDISEYPVVICGTRKVQSTQKRRREDKHESCHRSGPRDENPRPRGGRRIEHWGLAGTSGAGWRWKGSTPEHQSRPDRLTGKRSIACSMNGWAKRTAGERRLRHSSEGRPGWSIILPGHRSEFCSRPL